MLNSVSVQFFHHLLVLVGLYFGRLAFKIASCYPFKEGGDKFDVRQLMLGIVKNTIVLIGIAVVYIVGLTFGADLMVVRMGETSLTVQTALDVVVIAAVTTYGYKFVNKVREFFSVEEAVHEAKPVETEHTPDDYAERG